MTPVGRASTARAIALVGPNGAGKTTLFEALLHAAGAIDRQGSVDVGTSTGDAAPEARSRGQSVEVNLAAFDFMGDRYGLIDCPGSVEFAADGDCALPAVDLALVVVDPDPDKAILAHPTFKLLEALGTPHAVFVNRIDQARGRIRDLLEALQPMSAAPLVARQIPIREGDTVTGFVDLALERAYAYRKGAPSERMDLPADLAEREAEARFHMLEQLSDHDDALMEQLLNDAVPPLDLIFEDLKRETRENLIRPVLFGSALNGYGVRRLLKALRHDTPELEGAAARIGVDGPAAYVFKTAQAGQAGRLAYARVLSGTLQDGAELTLGEDRKGRVAGLFSPLGQQNKKIAEAGPGAIVALGKLEEARAGDLATFDGKARECRAERPARPPVYALALTPKERKDDVRLSASLTKLAEEDPSLSVTHDPDSRQLILEGQGEGHLAAAVERLKRRFGVEVATAKPRTGYRESIRKGVTQRGRHKKQTGGHGQFGDVVIEVRPLPRGEGFRFVDKVVGGVVPRQWIPAVEQGVRDALERGPLGFPVVDVEVTLVDGSHHSVDSSELAFRTAGRIAMSEALKACAPYLLEPVEKLTIHTPGHATSKITSSVSGRRGQILGFDSRAGWPGWDSVEVYLPHAERLDFIAEVRSVTQGLGTFEAVHDHMAELSGRWAEEAQRTAAA